MSEQSPYCVTPEPCDCSSCEEEFRNRSSQSILEDFLEDLRPTQATAGDEPEQKTNEELAASLKEKFGKVPKWFQRYASVPIGTRIMANRKKAGLTQIQLAARNGCRQSTISQIESGERNPSYGLAERLLESCGARLVVSREGDEPEGAREALKKIEKLASKYGPTREIWEVASTALASQAPVQEEENDERV